MYLVLDFHENTTIESFDVMMRLEDIGVLKKFYIPYHSETFDVLNTVGYIICKRRKKNNILNSLTILIVNVNYIPLPKGLSEVVRDCKISFLLD